MPTLQFKGKTFVQNHHLAVPYHQLIPDKDKSLTEKVSLDDNLIVHGDNLLALKALLPTYAGKVKCIYIDPPYNTGNESWVYNDNVKSPLIKEWIGKVVGKDGEDLVRHDKWLCMMMPRLKLLRDLMSNDGVIFVSIDDNEYAHLKQLMDEVFGESNFLATIIWQKVYSSRMDAKGFSNDHDYILVYRKSDSYTVPKIAFEQNVQQFTFRDEKTGKMARLRSLRKEGKGSRREDRPNLYYEVIAPDGTKVFPIRADGSEGRWRWAKDTFDKAVEKDEIEWIQKGNDWQVYVKQFFDDNATKPPSTFLSYEQGGHNHEANLELKQLFGESVFDSPKPSKLLKYLISFSSEDAIVLDSFAGSGTTAQAVLDLNNSDETNRKFILVECEDYADNVTAERVRKVIKGNTGSSNQAVKEGLGGSFSYFELGDAIEMESLLAGKSLPVYTELARYLFYTATGEEFKPEKVNESTNFIGSTDDFDVYAYYKPDLSYLKTTALTLDEARTLRSKVGSKPLLVFAPTKYVEQQTLDELNITFCQLPFEIYRMKK